MSYHAPQPVGYLGQVTPDRTMGLIVTGTVVAAAVTLGVWLAARRRPRRNRHRRR